MKTLTAASRKNLSDKSAPTLPLEERRTLIAKIVKEYFNPAFNNGKGKVEWRKAFAEHPEWEKQLGAGSKQGMKNIFNTLARMNLDKKSASNGTHKPILIAPPPPVGHTNGEVKFLENRKDRKALLSELLQKYTKPNGKTDWKKAFTENPNWKIQLGADTEKGYARVAAASGPVRKQLNLGRSSRRRNAPAEIEAETTQQYTDGCQHCPNCGFAVGAMNKFFNHQANA